MKADDPGFLAKYPFKMTWAPDDLMAPSALRMRRHFLARERDLHYIVDDADRECLANELPGNAVTIRIHIHERVVRDDPNHLADLIEGELCRKLR